MDGVERLARAVIRQAITDVAGDHWPDAHRALRWLQTGNADLDFWIAASGLRINTTVLRRLHMGDIRRYRGADLLRALNDEPDAEDNSANAAA